MRPLRRLLSIVPLLLAAPLAAQQGRITADTDVRSAPGGTVVAQLRSGTVWTAGATRDGFTVVTIEAWVDASRFTSGVDSFPTTIGGSANLRIREQPTLQGRILGFFRPGAGLTVVQRRDTWARIQRQVWVPSSAISVQAAARPQTSQPTTTPNRPSIPPQTAGARQPPAATGAASSAGNSTQGPPPAGAANQGASAPGSSSAPSATPADAPPPSGSRRTDREVPLRLGPNGQVLAMLDSGVIVAPQVREGGWVRVRIEGWVPESYFVPSDTAFGATLTAADLRADPEGHRGKLVRWRVQIIGMQTADPLRRDMRPDEPFLLAIGPTGEEATLYVTVPPALLAEARSVPTLTYVILTARVRTGRSNPTGAPILELVSIAKEN
jgi:hypothetical protein